jgi:2-isopropylmalate synthase
MDARNKKNREDGDPLWEVPYLLIDPKDIGRSYKAIIRINSQSGKGGVAYVLANEYGFELPKTMHVEVGNFINDYADNLQRELSSPEIYEAFMENFVDVSKPLELISEDVDRIPAEDENHRYRCRAEVLYNGEPLVIEGKGNGPINAFVNAMEQRGWKDFHLSDFRQHAIGGGSATDSAAYIQLTLVGGPSAYGCGTDSNIETAGLKALISAYNRLRPLAS